MSNTSTENKVILECKEVIDACRQELAKRIVGQESVIDDFFMALIAGGHVLLEGVPGLAKTLLVKMTQGY